MTKLMFTRENQFANKLRNYKILLNENVVGEIKNGETKEIDIVPGTYTLKLTIDSCQSKEIQLNVKEGENLQFQCGSRLKGMKILKAASAMNKIDEFVYLEEKL